MAPIGGVRAGYLSAGKDAIPDTLLSRTDDDASPSTTAQRGVFIRTNEFELDGISAVISSLTSGATTAYLTDSGGVTITTTDVSALSAGERFDLTVSSPLATETVYGVALDAGGSSWTQGFNTGALSSEITGQAFDLIAGYNDGGQNTSAYGVNDLRNLSYG